MIRMTFETFKNACESSYYLGKAGGTEELNQEMILLFFKSKNILKGDEE